MENKRRLSVLSLKKQNILRGKGIDIHSALRKVEKILPKDSLVLPKHKYTGLQTTPLEELVEDEGNPLSGWEPFNQVDDVAKIHDLDYSKAKVKQISIRQTGKC